MWRITFGKKSRSISSTFISCAAALLSMAAAAEAQMQVNIVEPALNAMASGSLHVRVSVTSVYELSSVRAQVEGQQWNLKFSQPHNAWTNSVPLTGLSFGSHDLVVTAQDFFGGTAQALRSFSVDNPPVLTVAAPLNDTVARGQIYMEAAASDDGPSGAVIRVYSPYDPFRPNRGLLLVGTNSVKGLVEATSILSGTVVFQATDSAGQTRSIPRRMWLEPGTHTNLVEKATAPGRILDFNATRTLYTVNEDVSVVSLPQFNSWTYGDTQPRLLEHDTGNVLAIGAPLNGNTPGLPDPVLGFGFVGSTGALIGYPPHGMWRIYGSLFHWKGTNILNLGLFTGGKNEVYGVGDTVAWRWNSPFDGDKVTLMDLTDTNRQFVLSFPYVAGSSIAFIAGFQLAPNYDLAYGVSNHVFRSRPASTEDPYANRTTTQLTSGAGGDIYGVASDGTNVVYGLLPSSDPQSFHIRLITPDGEETLATWPGIAGLAFKVNNGWVAYTKPGASGQTQIWTRSPVGIHQQRTFFSVSSTLESLGPKGEVTFLNNNVRYVSLPGVLPPFWVNSGQGSVRWDAGKLHVVLGRSVLEFRLGELKSSVVANGSTRLTFTGPNGLSYTVQGSTDLKHWNDLWTFAHTTGSISWTNPPTSANQFYRAVTVTSP